MVNAMSTLDIAIYKSGNIIFTVNLKEKSKNKFNKGLRQ